MSGHKKGDSTFFFLVVLFEEHTRNWKKEQEKINSTFHSKWKSILLCIYKHIYVGCRMLIKKNSSGGRKMLWQKKTLFLFFHYLPSSSFYVSHTLPCRINTLSEENMLFVVTCFYLNKWKKKTMENDKFGSCLIWFGKMSAIGCYFKFFSCSFGFFYGIIIF